MTAPAPAPLRAATDVKVAIIGAGFSGLCMGIKLKDAGITDFVIFEKADEVGGTWRENHYPGCACDVPSHLYSYSFETNPNWSRAFSPQPEILNYLKHCKEKYELTPFIRFGAGVTNAEWDEGGAYWRVTTSDGKVTTAQVLVSGAGGLHIPAYPDIPGIDAFEGTMFHSAEWDHSYDFKGKRVAVIGTGASAIQFVPAIAPDVAHMTVFQRTAPWVMPKLDKAFSDGELRRFDASPAARRVQRMLIYLRLEFTTWLFSSGKRKAKAGEKFGIQNIESAIKDPELRKAVTPNFPLGCKRTLLSNDWYPALARDNVDLVTCGIEVIKAHSVVMKDGREIDVDAILLGTGFKPFVLPEGLEILGVGRKALSAAWADHPEAYLGITVAGFPNYFLIMGPNTGLGSNSMIFMIESQVQYVLDAIKKLDKENLIAIAPRQDAQDTFNDQVQAKMENTVWGTGCNSWYQTADGHNAAIWPDTTAKYRKRTRHVDLNDYEVLS